MRSWHGGAPARSPEGGLDLDLIWEELVSGFPDATQLARLLIRLIAAALLGALVGFQREYQGKAAGLRTHMLVSMGSAFFVASPLEFGMGEDALSRVIQGITTGIGFIGGGSILKLSQERDIQGLTTAAGIWMTAAIGVAAGLGRVGAAAFGAGLAWTTLAIIGRVVARMETRG
jgi:putative Mg2+ transporter-C (MgtC) family protein